MTISLWPLPRTRFSLRARPFKHSGERCKQTIMAGVKVKCCIYIAPFPYEYAQRRITQWSVYPRGPKAHIGAAYSFYRPRKDRKLSELQRERRSHRYSTIDETGDWTRDLRVGRQRSYHCTTPLYMVFSSCHTRTNRFPQMYLPVISHLYGTPPAPLRRRLYFLVTFFPAEVHSAFHPSECDKMSTSCAYMCFITHFFVTALTHEHDTSFLFLN